MALLAGGAGETAARLGLAMLALQASIGAVNDVHDAELDRGRKPGKPIPRGAVAPGMGWAVAAAGLAVGLGLSGPSGAATAVLAAAGVGLGYAYDLRLSRTAFSWLPLALALPLLPVYAWLGATGTVPATLFVLVPVAVLAGVGLALGNGLADLDRDDAADVRAATVRLGRVTAWRLQALVLGAVVIAAIMLAPRPLAAGGAEPIAWILGLKGGAIVLLAGVALSGLPGPSRAGLRERGWELEAVGTALIGIAWVWGIAT